MHRVLHPSRCELAGLLGKGRKLNPGHEGMILHEDGSNGKVGGIGMDAIRESVIGKNERRGMLKVLMVFLLSTHVFTHLCPVCSFAEHTATAHLTQKGQITRFHVCQLAVRITDLIAFCVLLFLLTL